MGGDPEDNRAGVLSDDHEAQFVAHALTKFPISRPRAVCVAESFNTVYRVHADEGVFMMRVGRPPIIHHPHAPQAEESWTAHFASTGLAVPRVIRTRDGALRVSTAVPLSRYATLHTWVPGCSPEQPMSRQRSIALGELSARMHLASPPATARPDGVLDGREVSLFNLPDATDSAPSQYRQLFAERRAQAGDWIYDVWAGADEVPRVLHFDLTPKNVVFGANDAPAPIDFEDLCWGHRAQDLANSLYGLTQGTGEESLVAQFMEGYERFTPWPPALDGRQLRRLFVARRVAMINLALTLRRPGLGEYLRKQADALAKTPY